MAFPDDLLKDARHLASRGGTKPRQSSQRRAVSTAYYALFHLLTTDFVLNWKPKDQRARLARMFSHQKMRDASFRPDLTIAAEADLKIVVDSFAQLQQDRQSADYDTGRIWSRTDVIRSIELASAAFESWKRIRKERIALDHLLTMLGARRS